MRKRYIHNNNEEKSQSPKKSTITKGGSNRRRKYENEKTSDNENNEITDIPSVSDQFKKESDINCTNLKLSFVLGILDPNTNKKEISMKYLCKKLNRF